MLPKFDRKKDKAIVTDKMGRNATIALFHETADGRSDIKSIWSVHEWKEVFLHVADPTEYEAAMWLIGDWKHWKLICASWALKPYMDQWREELKVKLRSMAIANIKKQAAQKGGTTAAKWLIDTAGEGKLPKKVSAKLKEAEQEHDEILKHAKRMGTA